MTCLTPSVYRSDHIHFFDGAAGGYSAAAASMKGRRAELSRTPPPSSRVSRTVAPPPDNPRGHTARTCCESLDESA
jgi:hypothetical protein